MKTYIKNINGNWYAFGGSTKEDQVFSIGADCGDNYRWVARWNDAGIQYVARWSPSRHAAYYKARRAGEYCGEV